MLLENTAVFTSPKGIKSLSELQHFGWPKWWHGDTDRISEQKIIRGGGCAHDDSYTGTNGCSKLHETI